MKCVLLFIAAAVGLQGGESLNIIGPRALAVEALVPSGSPYYALFQIHDWSITMNGPDAINTNGTGFEAFCQTSTVLQVVDKRDTVTGASISLQTTSRNVTGRVQRNPTSATINGVPPMTFKAELWNVDGSGYVTGSNTITAINSGWNFIGAAFGDATGETSESVGFYRVMTTLVPANSIPPVTANPNCPSVTCLVEYKLDRNFNDTSGNCTSALHHVKLTNVH